MWATVSGMRSSAPDAVAVAAQSTLLGARESGRYKGRDDAYIGLGRATENQFELSQNFPKLRSMPKQSAFPASFRPDIRRGHAHRQPREGC